MSPNLRCLQHRYLHLRYLTGLAQSREKLFSIDVIWSKIQLPRGRYQFVCGSSFEFGSSFCFSFSSTVHTDKEKNGKVVLFLACASIFQRTWKWNLLSDFCYISPSSLRAKHETTWVDFNWR